MPRSIPRHLVLHERVVTRFPWTVISAEDCKPSLWQHDVKIGRVPMRFRTKALAQAAADKLNAEARQK